MPVLFVFLLEVNIALLIFCAGYYLVLRRLTFYTLNRIYLVMAIVFSSVYPFIKMDDFARQHQQIQTVIINLKVPAENFVAPIIQQPAYWHWLEIVFWAGAAVFALRLALQLVSLYKLYNKSKPGHIQEHKVRIVNADISPFSFWQSIYINPDNLNAADIESVLQHEQIHVKEWHTLDILLTEISVIFHWFNPGVWLMKKAVRENIEFITDQKILQNGVDSKAYQYSLLNVSFAATTSAGIANHFNFSTLKKRIKMMNAKRSSNVNLTRYAFLVPTVVVCLLAFSLTKAEIVKQSKYVYKTIASSVNSFNATKLDDEFTTIHKKLLKKARLKDTTKKTHTSTFTAIGVNSVADTGRKDTYTITKTTGGKDTYSVTKTTAGNDTASIFTVNGVTVSKAEFQKTAAQDIESIEVTGEDGGKRQIAVKLKQFNIPVGVDVRNVSNINKLINSTYPKNGTISVHTSTIKDNDGNIYTFTPSKSTDINKESAQNLIMGLGNTLYIIDGKEASEKDRKKITDDEMESFSILKGKAAIEKYGKKGKNGVVVIETRKYKNN